MRKIIGNDVDRERAPALALASNVEREKSKQIKLLCTRAQARSLLSASMRVSAQLTEIKRSDIFLHAFTYGERWRDRDRDRQRKLCTKTRIHRNYTT